ncbi:MAG: hypothetical protein JNL08_06140 [Planctomycetes bacterium]|nr:hypothetical protein [Planctomycetota bacterium]
MRVLATILLSLLPRVVAQEAPSTMATMRTLASAVTGIGKALEAGERSALATPLASIDRALGDLESNGLPAGAGAAAALATIRAAIADLRAPVGDGSASDAYDFARLRSGCTSCHLAHRDDNCGRGLFPNRGGAVSGTVALKAADGTARPGSGDIVLFLEGDGVRTEPLPRAPAITQRGRRFAPAVTVVTPGTTVRFPNDDVVFHNVFSLSRGNAFDLGTYGNGETQQRVLTQPGLVKVHCNIHPEMVADVLVLPTPHTTISAADGSWSIADVPPGDWVLRVWHPLADDQRHAIRVTDDTATEMRLEVRETRPRAPHRNKHGRSYEDKY